MHYVKNNITDLVLCFALLFSLFFLEQSTPDDFLIFCGIVALSLFALKWGFIGGRVVARFIIARLTNDNKSSK